MARNRPIHIVIGIDRLLGFGISHGQQIIVRVIRERRIPVNRVRQLRDPIQRIRRIEGLLAEGIGHVPEPPGGIQNPLRLAIERVFDLDQIPRFIGERGDVAQGIRDRERLPLGIDRDGRGLLKLLSGLLIAEVTDSFAAIARGIGAGAASNPSIREEFIDSQAGKTVKTNLLTGLGIDEFSREW